MKATARHLCLSFAVFLAVIVTGCSSVDGPLNLEPAIMLNDATDITRNDATLGASVTLNGEPLSYLRFQYGETQDMSRSTEDITDAVGNINAEIHNLKAGTTYYFRAVAGTKTATFTTPTLSFTTLPNDAPSVTAAKVLSSGPTCIMISFDIVSDGGDPVTEAGCEISNISSADPWRVSLPADELSEGSHNLVLSGLSPLAEHHIVTYAENINGMTKSEPLVYVTGSSIILGEAGVLETLTSDFDLGKDNICISGFMDGTDFCYLRSLVGAPRTDITVDSRIENVDISDVIIAEGGMSYDGSHFTENNCVTTGLFGDCRSLRSIVLPMSATELRRDAFIDCIKLETIEIPASSATVLPSSGCTALVSIDAAQNSNYTSVDGVLFDKDVTEIIWFPVGKEGEYELPSTVTAIGENAFRGAKITKLCIGNSVKTIAVGAFSASAIADITLPDNLTNLPQGIFQDCGNLRVIRIGSGCQYIGSYAFDGSALSELHIAAAVPPFVKDDTFDSGLFTDCILYIPAKSKAIYRNHRIWGKFKNIIAED